MKVEWLGDDLKLLGKLPKEVKDAFARAERPAVIVGAGRAGGGRPRRGAGAGRAAGPHQGRLERLQRPPHLGVAHGLADPRLCAAGRHRRHRGGGAGAGAAARRGRNAGRPLQGRVTRSTSATTATMARSRPTWCSRARPMPRSTAPTSIPKGGCSAARKRRSRRARRARTGRSCARCRELAGKTLPFDSFGQLRAAMVAEYPQLGRDGLIDLPWSPPKLTAKAEGPDPLPDRRFLPDQRDLPQQPDDAPLLRRAGARRRSIQEAAE